ncbi:MAG: preprotein translocase subunit YajC [Alphaproteobacteria bacterium]|jgi:preprotein translocase subunit YajC
MFTSSAYAQSASAIASDPTITFIVPMLLVFGIFYFLVIRPQQKKAKEHQEKITTAKKGDKVVTGGGIEGVIAHVREDVYEIEIAPNVRIKVRKNTLIDIAPAKK